MKINRLSRALHVLASLLAVSACSLTAATVAQASEEAPFWSVEGKRLHLDETREITVKAYDGTKEPVTVEAELLGIKAKVECESADVAKGSFLAGSDAGEPGSIEETEELSDCQTINNGAGCKVKEPIKTERIRGTLAENTESPRVSLMEFEAAAGTEAKIVTLLFEGAKCVVKETEVGKGLVVGSVYTDPEVTGEESEAVAVTTTDLLPSYLTKFPDAAKEIAVWKGGKSETLKVTPFKAFGNEAKMRGALLVLLASGQKYAAETAEPTSEAPFWSVEGKRLYLNETREMTVKAYDGTKEPVTVEAELLGIKAKVECESADVAKGSFLAGASAGEPGSIEETEEFSDCQTINNGAGCKVKEPIKTERIRGTLAENTEFPKVFLVEFEAAAGTEAKIVTLLFEGAKCVVKETEVGKGLVVGSVYTDPEVTGEEPEAVAVTTTDLLPSYLTKFPDAAKEIAVWKGGKSETLKVTPFKAFGNEAKMRGALLVLLASGQKYAAET